MLKPGVQSSLVRGLEQWLWFLGVDASNSRNNLLVRNDFVKYKAPGTPGSSRYRGVWRGDRIDLHSFCVGAYTENSDGFIFIRARHQCFLYTASKPPAPGFYAEENLIAAVTHETLDRFHTAAVRFLDWLIHYERWVDRVCGSNYRAECYRAYQMKWQPPAAGLAWFQRFIREPRCVESVRSVVSDMALLEPIAKSNGPNPMPPAFSKGSPLRVR